MTDTRDNPTLPADRAIGSLAIALGTGTVAAAIGGFVASEPIGRAFACVFGVVLLLPVAWSIDRVTRRDGIDLNSYALACLPLVLAASVFGSIPAGVVVASVAISLGGMLALLAFARLPVTLAIALLIVQSAVFLSWPVWAGPLLLKFDSQELVDLLVKIGPPFAINGAIDPTDPYTHRPLAYRLMNLGQDIPYTMPRSIWPCVIVHLLVALPGFVLTGWSRREKVTSCDEREP